MLPVIDNLPLQKSSGKVVAVIGGGPAGLMAAETLCALGHEVHVFDSMPTVGRKFLLAGRGGLNLTHAEPFDQFLARYHQASDLFHSMLRAFDNAAVRDWASGLGQDTFVGSSGRVFPVGMKASPLLRAWLTRLQQPQSGKPVQFHHRHRWTGWRDGTWVFSVPGGERLCRFDATVLALGGGSWSRLGSDGGWVQALTRVGISVSPLVASNCGFEVATPWTPVFRQRCSGAPLKSVVMTVLNHSDGGTPLSVFVRKGECVITDYGLEGGLVYAASHHLRNTLNAQGHADVALDLMPHRDLEWLEKEISRPRGSRSLSTHLKSRVGLDGVKLSLVYEVAAAEQLRSPVALARLIKSLPLRLGAPRPIDEAISTSGGVEWSALDDNGMCRALPGVFFAGEMLEWDAPTGGYLLTGCLASGRWAGQRAHHYLSGI